MRRTLRAHKVTIVLSAVVAACFGPYVVGGIRTEQAVIYALAIPAGAYVFRQRPKPWFPPLLVWFSILLIALMVGMDPPSSTRPSWAAFLAGADNMMLPIAAAMLALWLIALNARPRSGDLLQKLAAMVLTVLALNAILTVVQLTIATPAWLGMFWTSLGSVGLDTVAGKALTDGRISGVFNQPLESGLAYSVGGILAVYWLHYQVPRIRHIIIGILAILGGLLSVSKVFLFVGAPLAALLFIYLERHRTRRIVLALVATVPVLGLWLSSGWQGADRALGLFNSLLEGRDRGAVEIFTAGRYGEVNVLGAIYDRVALESPVLGFGAAGIPVASDSSYIQIMIVAGFVGLALYVLLLSILALSLRIARPSPSKATAIALLTLSVVAGLGGATFTANRAGPLLVLGLVFALTQARSPWRCWPDRTTERRGKRNTSAKAPGIVAARTGGEIATAKR